MRSGWAVNMDGAAKARVNQRLQAPRSAPVMVVTGKATETFA